MCRQFPAVASMSLADFFFSNEANDWTLKTPFFINAGWKPLYLQQKLKRDRIAFLFFLCSWLVRLCTLYFTSSLFSSFLHFFFPSFPAVFAAFCAEVSFTWCVKVVDPVVAKHFIIHPSESHSGWTRFFPPLETDLVIKIK